MKCTVTKLCCQYNVKQSHYEHTSQEYVSIFTEVSQYLTASLCIGDVFLNSSLIRGEESCSKAENRLGCFSHPSDMAGENSLLSSVTVSLQFLRPPIYVDHCNYNNNNSVIKYLGTGNTVEPLIKDTPSTRHNTIIKPSHRRVSAKDNLLI